MSSWKRESGSGEGFLKLATAAMAGTVFIVVLMGKAQSLGVVVFRFFTIRAETIVLPLVITMLAILRDGTFFSRFLASKFIVLVSLLEVLEVLVSNSNNNFRHWKSLERLFLVYKSNPTRRTYKVQVLRVWFKLQGGGIEFDHLWCERCFIEAC